MDKSLRILTILLVYIALFVPSGLIQAQTATQINAGILAPIWYSNTNIADGDEVTIFTGVQNHSTEKFSAEAMFLVDDKVVSKTNFVSMPESLVEINGTWRATGGNHNLKFSLTNVVFTNSTSTFSLLATESEQVNIYIKPRLTVENVKETATEVVTGIVDKLDDVTQSLSEKILEYKKGVNPVIVTSSSSTDSGTLVVNDYFTTTATSTTDDTDNMTTSAYNLALSFLASSVLHWKLTLGALIALGLVVKFTG